MSFLRKNVQPTINLIKGTLQTGNSWLKHFQTFTKNV